MIDSSHLAVFYRGNRLLQLEETTARPPSDHEVSLKVVYCGICGSDIHIYHGDMDQRVGLNRIIGHEMSGVVTEVGTGVTRFRPGDHVTVRPTQSCGDCPACRDGFFHVCHRLNCLGLDSDGALQKIWNVPEQLVYPIPPDLSLTHAALTEPVAVACHSLRLSKLQSGEEVLVIGAGTIGILTALVAREAGGKVIISEPNSLRADIAKKLGFAVIDSRKENLPSVIDRRTGGKGASVIFEVSGHPAGARVMTECAASRARIMMVAIHPQPSLVDLLQVFRRELVIIGTRIQEPEDFEKAVMLLNSGKIPADKIITGIRPLGEIQAVFDETDQPLGASGLKTLIQVN